MKLLQEKKADAEALAECIIFERNELAQSHAGALETIASANTKIEVREIEERPPMRN